MTNESGSTPGQASEAETKKQRPALRWLKRIGLGLGAILFLGGAGGGGYAYTQVSAFDASMQKVYDVPPLAITASTDPAVIERGRYLAHTQGGCSLGDCHGEDLGGGKVMDVGPIGTFAAPNITPANMSSAYTDGELARLLRHGIKKNGTGVRMMPVRDWNWLPDADLAALISYVRSRPTVNRATKPMVVGALGKILDRRGLFPLDIARSVDHDPIELGPSSPSPTPAYGRFVAQLCTGCHGPGLSGGPIPGAPPDFAVPLNLTPDATGLRGWSYADFERLAKEGVRKNGAKVDPFMPRDAIAAMTDTDRRALWAYLQSVPPRPFGGR